MATAVGLIGALGETIWGMLLGGSILLLLFVFNLGIWRPYKLHAFYKKMRLESPKHRPLLGNLPEIWKLKRQARGMKWEVDDPSRLAARSLPHLTLWSKLYGKMFTYTEGAKVNLCVLDTEIIKEMLEYKADCYCRSSSGWLWLNSQAGSPHLKDQVLDTSIIHKDPEHWATLRRTWGSMSEQDPAQGCLEMMVEISHILVRKWASSIKECSVGSGGVHVDARGDVTKVTMEMFLASLLGSTVSTDQLEALGLDVCEEEDDDHLSFADLLRIPTISDLILSDHTHPSGCRSSRNGRIIRLLTETIESRLRFSNGKGQLQEKEGERKRDLLDLLMSTCGRLSSAQAVEKLVADCRMLIAAQEATSQLIAQTLQLLACHSEWQARARGELLDFRPLDLPGISEDGEQISNSYPNLAKLKIMNMILNESLRLYPPILVTEKLCTKRHRLGKYKVLPGTSVQIPIVLLHHSTELWGDDALTFRPDRFAHGAASRRPFAFLPFSAGPSVCLGYNLALQEAKIVLTSILSSFSFEPVSDNLTPTCNRKPLLVRTLESDDFTSAAKHRVKLRQTSSPF
ncbi:hypothetical protein R1sor_027520 [Riccia sorocarpa]|uniref:Cytochrome P450 n=1 Tax=Riccia sorocarpa TaxID=122646 RepID=A0ABD3GHA9_9MARC